MGWKVKKPEVNEAGEVMRIEFTRDVKESQKNTTTTTTTAPIIEETTTTTTTLEPNQQFNLVFK
jgi:hypothetical protein